MDLQIFDFEWWVADDYALTTAAAAGRVGSASALLLGEADRHRVDIDRRADAGRTYKPFESDPALHRRFARDVRDAHSALEFVRQYGFLGAMLSGPRAEFDSVEHILGLRESLRETLLLIDHNPTYSDDLQGSRGRKSKAVPLGTRFRDFARLLTRSNKLALGNVFNASVTPHLTLRINATNPKRQAIQIVPRSLISWMWLRVAQEITGEAMWKRCANPTCGNPYFSVDASDGRQVRRKFCNSFACRKAASRRAQAENETESKRKGRKS